MSQNNKRAGVLWNVLHAAEFWQRVAQAESPGVQPLNNYLNICKYT